MRAPPSDARRAGSPELTNLNARPVVVPHPRPRHPLLALVFEHTNSRIVHRQSIASCVRDMPLYPVSALVLAAHCSLLPPLPQGLPSNGRRAALTLPVIPLTDPSPETFALLHAYLHTMRPDTLLASLLPGIAASIPHMSAASSSAGSGKLLYVPQFSWERHLRLAHALAGTGREEADGQMRCTLCGRRLF
ncbi:hypothetical protein BV20DRAFT_974997 [Pilatotrama ljubarskyi]|nr:hypothetical protein BV20DRAFT_974997 [Pilatotrama ljubarskyi]